MARWMLYGAYGYTGQLLVEEALQRGHHPILAGRSAAKLAPLAERVGLEHRVIDLQDSQALSQAINDVDLVFHAAGPFVFTSDPMIHACLAQHVHYLDIAGDIPNLLNTFTYAEVASQAGIAIVSGAGFDVIPTDCLAKYVANKLPGAIRLEIAIDALSAVSSGTFKSLLEMMPLGSWARENGALFPSAYSASARDIHFTSGVRPVIPVPWGDLVTAYYSTGIPTIRTYLAISDKLRRLARLAIPAAKNILRNAALRRWASRLANGVVKGPDITTRRKRRSSIWACAVDVNGRSVQAWLDTLEAYQFTAVAGIRAVERVLASSPKGVLTPSMAFGADFPLEIGDTRRFDKLQKS